jgi:hypothetical protein
MKTDDLVSMLSNAPEPLSAGHSWRRLVVALGVGTILSAVLMIATLGPRPDLAEAARLSMFWVKLGFPALLGLGTVVAVWRLAHPGMKLKAAPLAIAVPVLGMALLGAVVLLRAAPGERTGLVLGETWQSCPFNIAMLSVPTFIALMWLMKGLAPTRPAFAGAASGLLAGAVAALVYALHCPELAAPFISIWYVLGMLIPTLVGAAYGLRSLRW